MIDMQSQRMNATELQTQSSLFSPAFHADEELDTVQNMRLQIGYNWRRHDPESTVDICFFEIGLVKNKKSDDRQRQNYVRIRDWHSRTTTVELT